MQLSVCVFLCLSCAVLVNAENILGLFPTTAKSAFLASEAIMKALARRGHNVTVVSCFPQTIPFENYTDISIRDHREILVSSVNIGQLNLPYDLLDLTPIFLGLINSMENIMKSNEIKNLLSSNDTFNVVFHEMFVDDVFLLFARKFKAPIIAVGPSYILPWAAGRFAIPQNPAYIPVLANGYSRKMTFLERLHNTFTNIRTTLNYWFTLVPMSIETYKKCFQDNMPSVKEAVKNVSLYFVNTHFTLLGARPYPPQVVEIGGIHVQPALKLPQDLDEWMNKATYGVIYFSFGSMLRGATLPADKVKVFLEVFRSIPQQIIWKWEDNPLEEFPDNVKAMKWLPQRDIMAHSKLRLFITHGGLLGVTEAIVSGVPILGIPTNMDQANNVAALEENGVAIGLDYNNITVENVFYAINTLITDRLYTENAKQVSRRFLDRPQSPLETALYWTEYVIRHKGAPHLQSSAVHLTWYQYYLLDVIAVSILVLFVLITFLFFIIRSCIRILYSKRVNKLKQK